MWKVRPLFSRAALRSTELLREGILEYRVVERVCGKVAVRSGRRLSFGLIRRKSEEQVFGFRTVLGQRHARNKASEIEGDKIWLYMLKTRLPP